MRPLSRLLAAALLVALAGSSAPAADKDEDKAKEAAVAFLKAAQAKDVDAALKVCDTPFVFAPPMEDAKLHKDQAALKAFLKELAGKVKDPKDVPTEVEKVVAYADVRGKLPDKDGKRKAAIDEAAGK